MNQNFTKFLKYYNTKSSLEKMIIRDLFQDILLAIKTFYWMQVEIQKLRKVYEGNGEDMSLSERDILNGCCLLTYKKTNRYSEAIFNNQIFPDAMMFAQIARERRNTIKELHNIGVIEIVHEDIAEDVLKIWEREWYFTVDQQGRKQIQLSLEQFVNSINAAIPPTLDACIFQTEVRKLFDWIRDEIEYGIGEDELNRQLNLDKSYHATCSFHADSETIQDLIDDLKRSESKEYVSQVSFRDWKLFINNHIFILKWNKASEFLSFLAQYFSSFPDTKKVTIWDLVSFWDQIDTSSFKHIEINDIQGENIRTSLLRTIRKNLRKKYQNWDIFVIEKEIISLDWEA